eukprot:740590-Hanusia_phi.AAC.1
MIPGPVTVRIWPPARFPAGRPAGAAARGDRTGRSKPPSHVGLRLSRSLKPAAARCDSGPAGVRNFRVRRELSSERFGSLGLGGLKGTV